MSNIDDILDLIKDDIISNVCVLVLGPDLYIKEMDEKIWERKEYLKKLENDIPGIKFLENDELFTTPDDLIDYTLERKIKNYYTGPGDLKLIELLSTIKFPLIINASADEALEEFIKIQDKSVQFDYFQGDIDNKKEIRCDVTSPVVYNVFGKASNSQSLIISHKQLYENIQKILPADSFPLSIRTFIQKARSFLFLGFKFDSWSYQLLSYKILSGNNPTRPIRLSSTHYNDKNSTNIIMSYALGMSFTNDTPAQLLESLIARINENVKKNVLLRQIDKQKKYTSYLSYARKNNENPKLDEIVKILLESFNGKSTDSSHLKIIYDKEDLHYGQSIDSFMTRIGKGKTAIVIVGDKYLKSEYCMTEALRIYKHNNKDNRVFIILISDVNFCHNMIDKKTYLKYWKNELVKITRAIDPDKYKVMTCLEILKFMPDFIDKIHAYNHFKLNLVDIIENPGIPTLSISNQHDFDTFVCEIISKMKEE